MNSPKLRDYCNTFVQPVQYYTTKQPGSHWVTKRKPMGFRAVEAHLEGRYDVGSLAKWYPEFGLLDIDSVCLERVEEIRERLGLSPVNSMLGKSESPESYHILFSPRLNNEPPTAYQLDKKFRMFSNQCGVEIFPQRNKTIRLPFGRHWQPIDEEYRHAESWQDCLYWFHKLNDYNLDDVLFSQLELDLRIRSRIIFEDRQEAQYLLEHGLQSPSTRHDSQYKILDYFWRMNWLRGDAEDRVFNWIKEKHNGHSKDVWNHQLVKEEIKRQARWIWDNRALYRVYPDTTHNNHNGWISKPDIVDIVKVCQGSKPKIRFLFGLIKYAYPRQYRDSFPVHTDKLIEWGSIRIYQKRLDELDALGIAKRGSSYLAGQFSKSLKVNWQFRAKDSSGGILYQGRSIDTFDDTIRLTFEPRDFRELLTASNVKQSTATMTIKRIFESSQKDKHIINTGGG